MSKIYSFLLILFLLSSCVFQPNQQTNSNQTSNSVQIVPNETENSETKIKNLLQKITDETGYNFSQPEETTFNWRIIGEKIGKMRDIQTQSVQGWQIGVSHITDIDSVQGIASDLVIKNILESAGFVLDRYNLADGIINGISGFTKENQVCLLQNSIDGGEKGLESPTIYKSFILKCGVL